MVDMIHTNSSIELLKEVDLIAMDFDGIHTNGFVYVDQDGNETVRCSRRDSLGLNMLVKHGVQLVVISKETNPVVKARCEKLGIPYVQSVGNARGKAEVLTQWCSEQNISLQRTLFVGDDVNDIEAMRLSGVSVTVADGHEEVKKIADITLTRNGGDHALRELCDLILSVKGLSVSY